MALWIKTPVCEIDRPEFKLVGHWLSQTKIILNPAFFLSGTKSLLQFFYFDIGYGQRVSGFILCEEYSVVMHFTPI